MSWLAFIGILSTIIFETGEQLAFKQAAKDSRVKVLWTIVGIALYIPHLISWFFTLSLIPLSLGAPLLGASYITVPLASGLVFREKLDRRRWLGIGLIVLGLMLISMEMS